MNARPSHRRSDDVPDRDRRRTMAVAVVVLAAVSAAAFGPPARAAAATPAPGALRVHVSTTAPVVAGVATIYTIRVTNRSGRTAGALQIRDYLPAGLNLVALLRPDLCRRTRKPLLANTAFNCNGGDVPRGGTVRVRFVARAAGPFTYTDEAAVSATVRGASVASSTAVPIRVRPGPTDLQVRGSAITSTSTAGARIGYTFTVRNVGRQTAYGIMFDAMSSPSAPRAVTTDVGVCDPAGAVPRCAIGDLAVGRSANVTILVDTTGTPQDVTATGTATMRGADVHPSDDRASVVVHVR